ncbi:sialate O-acetylesterase [Paraglaciecola sp. 20A4]|uniref:sialate O-acetylesterase n=1 Tax=Paraglaciecola sp. 20A4 TaxID=2687288 RepID=UPI001F116CDD|nr:sialate O-acetylesterase [Paraglaciecola sp. 20A4]
MATFQTHALSLSPLFSDHMVLQRDKPVRVWGEGPENHSITVTLLNQSYATQTDENGHWQVMLPAHAKAGPFSLTISANKIITINDVYYGEVWIAGGQSNMEWKLKGDVIGNEQAIASAQQPLIRFFDVPDTLSPVLQSQLPASKWQVATPNTVGRFSAVAWFFALQLQKTEDVAVGIIESNWGGTPAEAWTDIDIVAATPGYEKEAAEVKAKTDWPELLAANKKQQELKWQRINSPHKTMISHAAAVNYDDEHWQDIDLPNTGPLHHFVWLRKTFTLESVPPASITINLGTIRHNALIFINGHLIAKTYNDNAAPSTDSIYKIATQLLKAGKNVIAIRAANGTSNQVFIGEKQQMWVDIGGHKQPIEENWRFSNSVEMPMPKVVNYSYTPSFLYNAMIYPLLPYTAQGVVWYQGESNINKHAYYHTLFANLISNWRARAESPNMPFLFVQLAAYLPHKPLQPESKWAYLRDAQRQTLALPNTGMAVAIDVGDAEDLHPKNKRDVGERLWRIAANKIYGIPTVPTGPDFTHFEIKQSEIKIYFDNAEGLKTNGNQAVEGFIIAGQDKVFRVAQAFIHGQTVVVSHPDISEPLAVRYAWADNPLANVINNVRLPAMPFRTDAWSASEVRKK